MPYYLNATAEQLRHLFRSRERGRVYTAAERRLSLYLDIDAATVKSLSSYAAQWGEKRTTLQREWAEITRDVWMQATSDGRQWTNQAAAYVNLAGLIYDPAIPDRVRTAMQGKETFRPSADEIHALQSTSWADSGQIVGRNGQKTGPNDHKNAGFGQIVGRNGQIPGSPIPSTPSAPSNTPQKATPSSPPGGAPPGSGGAAEKPRSPKKQRFTPPSPEEAAEYFEQIGRPDLAEPYLDHFTANGWRVGGRAPMKDWRAAARQWVRNDEQWHGKPNSRNGAGRADPKRAHAEAREHPAEVYERARRVALAALGDE